MSTQTEDLKLLVALKELKEHTERHTRFNGTQFFKERRVKYPGCVWRLIRENQIVEIKGFGCTQTAKWNSIEPNIKMAQRLREESLAIAKSYQKETEKIRGFKEKMDKSQLSIYNALKEMHALYSDKCYHVSFAHVLARHKAENATTLAVILRECNYVERRGSRYKYVGGEPNLEMVDNIINKVSECLKIRNNKHRNKKQEPEQESPKVQPTTFNVEKCKAEPKQYKKEFKIFGLTIYSTITTQL